MTARCKFYDPHVTRLIIYLDNVDVEDMGDDYFIGHPLWLEETSPVRMIREAMKAARYHHVRNTNGRPIPKPTHGANGGLTWLPTSKPQTSLIPNVPDYIEKSYTSPCKFSVCVTVHMFGKFLGQAVYPRYSNKPFWEAFYGS